jgi:hypothetical protein
MFADLTPQWPGEIPEDLGARRLRRETGAYRTAGTPG